MARKSEVSKVGGRREAARRIWLAEQNAKRDQHIFATWNVAMAAKRANAGTAATS